ncbi:hypothetical protein SAMN05216567_12259 [Variovorax sp. OK605]|jgi:hypothetical protein|uniref:hypothetical protein n=1 Tax=Variovorax sp. OK605 TaxID=1855317 RepID=UPI0008E01302|nr:hypothetical protein [Variovorax sp. OK605]SFQ62131.1 hypothetical protein SAMN05216567_12259 [Variovorax sp. OK605]
MAVVKLADGTYRVDDRIFPDADEAIAYDGLRNAGTESPVEVPEDSPQPVVVAARSGFSLWWLVLIIPAGLFLLVFAIGALSGPPSERQIERLAIELCWKEHSSKAQDPGTQQFIAGSCKMMESEFRAKYGVDP